LPGSAYPVLASQDGEGDEQETQGGAIRRDQAGVSVRDYLAAILPGLADVTIQRLLELTPNAWASSC